MQVIPKTDFQHGPFSLLAGVTDNRLSRTCAEDLERAGLVTIKTGDAPAPVAPAAPPLRTQAMPDPVKRGPGRPPKSN